MRDLGAPSSVAVLCVATAATLLPEASSRLPDAVPAALALLLALSIAAGGRFRFAGLVLGAGALLAVGGVGYDLLRGHEGVLELTPGSGRSTFEEHGSRGEPLGLRPLGFPVQLVSIGDRGRAELLLAGVPGELGPERALSWGGFRFGDPAVTFTGRVSRLRLGVSGPGSAQEVDLEPGVPARVGDVRIALDQYYPDFALDESQQPYSRSRLSENPAAVLRVTRGGQAWRVFVIRSMPGIHQAEGLGLTISLVAVEPERALRVAVHRQPAAPLVGLGLLLVAGAVALEVRPREVEA